MAYYLVMEGQPDGTRMWYTLAREYYWSQMASDAFSTVGSFQNFTWLWGTHFKQISLMKLFSATRFLEFFGMNVLGPLKKNRAEEYLHSGHSRPIYQNDESHCTLV